MKFNTLFYIGFRLKELCVIVKFKIGNKLLISISFSSNVSTNCPAFPAYLNNTFAP